MFSNASRQLKIAGMLPHGPNHANGSRVIRELLRKGSISEYAYFDLVDDKVGEKLLEANVFADHFNSGQITFQSTVMKRFCEKESAYWEEEARNAPLRRFVS